ncbi:MAG: TrmH family RNA methyltransferase [Bacilli bacterium]|nr:TrmH family RNA methyltransferase [Bacilli bacterium]
MLNIGKSHEVIKLVKKVKTKPSNLIYIEDLSVLSLLMEQKKQLEVFLVCEELIFSDEAKKIVAYFKDNSKEIYSVSKKVYDDLIDKGFSAGMIGLYAYEFKSLKEVKNKHFVVVLDGLETPGNLGTILRTCDAYNVDLVILVDSKTNVYNPKVVQSSRGMSLSVDIVNTSYEEAQAYLLNNNFDIYLGEPELGKSYLEYDYLNNVALVFGNERFGINKNWYSKKHHKLYVPMYGKMTSLNVSVAASIVICYAGININKRLG